MIIYGNGGYPPDRYDGFDSLRSSIGAGPQGDGIDVKVVENDPYGYYRLQFLNSSTGRVLATTPNLDPGSRIYLCDADFESDVDNDTYSATISEFTTEQLMSVKDIRVGDLVLFDVKKRVVSDSEDLLRDTFCIGVVNQVLNNGNVIFRSHIEMDASLVSSMVRDNSITTQKLVDGAVTEDKLEDGAVTLEKLDPEIGIYNYISDWLDNHPEATTTVEDGSITTEKLADDAVTAEKVADKSITQSKISDDLDGGLYYDDDFTEEQVFPMTVGTISASGITVTVHPNGIVEIKGTATADIRFRLNDGLEYASHNSDLIQVDHSLDPGWYTMRLKLIEGTFQTSEIVTGRCAMYFYYDLGNGDTDYMRIYAYDGVWNYDYPFFAALKHRRLNNIILLIKRGETFDCKVKIDIHKSNQRDYAKQLYFMKSGSYHQYSVKERFHWIAGTVTGNETAPSDAINGSNNRIAMEMPVKFDFEMKLTTDDPLYETAVRQYPDPDNWRSNSELYGWSGSLDPRIIPAGTYVRVLLRKSDNSSFTKDQFYEALKHLVLYQDLEGSMQDIAEEVVESSVQDIDVTSMRNPEAINVYSALVRGGGVKVAHITDTHSDPIRWNNFVKACETIKPDIIVHTGDVAKADLRNDITYLTENLPSIPMILALGNHDVGTGHGFAAGGIDTATAITTWVVPINEKYSWNNVHPYYYYDVVSGSQKVRFICLYMYDYDENDGTSFVDRVGVYYTQDQIDWFIDTLKDAKSNGLSVVVAAHEPDKVLPYEEGFGKFNGLADYSSHSYKRTTDSPICDIIETFINGGTINQTYVQANELAPNVPPIVVNDTFLAGGDFVCWLVGHRHGDYYGWIPDTHQLLITLAAGCVGIGSIYSTLSIKDLGQVLGTKTEDCFNFYIIKPSTHTIALIRFGADTLKNLEKRDYMIQDYHDYTRPKS